MTDQSNDKREKVCRHPLAKRPILYTDSIKGEQVCRDDLWAVTTEELNALTLSHGGERLDPVAVQEAWAKLDENMKALQSASGERKE
jgi:hypothetical protein